MNSSVFSQYDKTLQKLERQKEELEKQKQTHRSPSGSVPLATSDSDSTHAMLIGKTTSLRHHSPPRIHLPPSRKYYHSSSSLMTLASKATELDEERNKRTGSPIMQLYTRIHRATLDSASMLINDAKQRFKMNQTQNKLRPPSEEDGDTMVSRYVCFNRYVSAISHKTSSLLRCNRRETKRRRVL